MDYRKYIKEMEDYERSMLLRSTLEKKSEEIKTEPRNYIQSMDFEIKCAEYPQTKARKKIIGYVNLEPD